MKKSVIFAILACCFFGTGIVFAQGGGGITIGTIAQAVTNTLDNVAALVTAISYVAGMGFAIGAILKFKAHKDNPTQIPVGTPIALMFVAAALIFLPTIFSAVGGTLFGDQGQVGGTKGVTTFDGAQ